MLPIYQANGSLHRLQVMRVCMYPCVYVCICSVLGSAKIPECLPGFILELYLSDLEITAPQSLPSTQMVPCVFQKNRDP